MKKESENNKNFKIKLIATNLVTLIRLFGALAIIPVFLNYGGLIAAGLLGGVFITDAIDGKMARKFETSTFLGASLDAICDKLSGIMSLFALLFATKLALIPIISELSILAINVEKYKHKQNVQSSFLGKLKTCALSLGIVLAFIVAGLENKNIIATDKLINYMLPIFLGMIPFEIATIKNYLSDYKKGVKSDKEEQILDVQELKSNQIEQKKKDLEDKKEYLKKYYNGNVENPLLDHDFYEEKKNDNDFNLYLKAYLELKKQQKGISRTRKRD